MGPEHGMMARVVRPAPGTRGSTAVETIKLYVDDRVTGFNQDNVVPAVF